MSESGRYEIEFTEGGVGLFETLATGGLAPIVEKTIDTITGDDSHGWYCTITDKITGLKDSQWGVTKAEAQEKTFHTLKIKIEEYEKQLEREREEEIQRRREAKEAKYQQQLRQQEQQSSYQTNSEDDDSGCIKALAFLIIVAAVVWFVFAVAIPLILINVATISLIAGFIKKDWIKYLFPLSILGGIGIVFDYNYGWATKALVTNVPFFQEFIPAFFYLNIVTGLIAAYFLTRNLLNDKYGIPEREFSKRNLIIMGCLLIVGSLTIGLQKYFESKSSNTIQLTETKNLNSTPVNAGQIELGKQIYSGDWLLKSGGTHPFTGEKLNSSLSIIFEEGNRIKINYIDGLSGGVVYEIVGRYDADKIIGDFYGHKNNVKISQINKNEISFSIDPYAEFDPVKGQVYTRSLSVSGTYSIYNKADPSKVEQSVFTIKVQSDETFSIQGPGWKGSGKINGTQGYYDWVLNNGQKGRTTITVNADNTIQGHVVGNGNGLDWWYIGRKIKE